MAPCLNCWGLGILKSVKLCCIHNPRRFPVSNGCKREPVKTNLLYCSTGNQSYRIELISLLFLSFMNIRSFWLVYLKAYAISQFYFSFCYLAPFASCDMLPIVTWARHEQRQVPMGERGGRSNWCHSEPGERCWIMEVWWAPSFTSCGVFCGPGAAWWIANIMPIIKPTSILVIWK